MILKVLMIKRWLRQKLEDFLVWALTKINIQRLKMLTVDDKRIVIGLSKIVKDDGEWHLLSASVSCWVKISPKRKIVTAYDDVTLWIGNKVAKKIKSHYYKTK